MFHCVGFAFAVVFCSPLRDLTSHPLTLSPAAPVCCHTKRTTCLSSKLTSGNWRHLKLQSILDAGTRQQTTSSSAASSSSKHIIVIIIIIIRWRVVYPILSSKLQMCTGFWDFYTRLKCPKWSMTKNKEYTI